MKLKTTFIFKDLRIKRAFKNYYNNIYKVKIARDSKNKVDYF